MVVALQPNPDRCGPVPVAAQASARDRAFLRDVITAHNVRSVYDAGCGTAHWQPLLLRQLQAGPTPYVLDHYHGR